MTVLNIAAIAVFFFGTVPLVWQEVRSLAVSQWLVFLVLGTWAGLSWWQRTALARPISSSWRRIKTLEFRDQDLKDILLSLGELNKVSIVPDETVEGKATSVFANMEFDQALKVFLDTYEG